MNNISQYQTEFEIKLLSVDRVKLKGFFLNLIKNYTREQLINDLIAPSLTKIGSMWENGDAALSQIYMSGKLCEEIVTDFFPKYSGTLKNTPKIGLAVLEDYHAFGMQIIRLYLKATGIKVITYELGITSEELELKVIEDKIEILLISTLMLRSALKIKLLIRNFRKNKKEILVIVGGAPFNLDKSLWIKVGADAMSVNAFEVIPLIKKLKKVEF